MKKAVLIALGIVGVLGLVLVAVGAIVDGKYGVIRTSPVVSHDHALTSTTRVTISLKPRRAQTELTPIIMNSIPQAQRPPEWVIGKILPYEMAAIVDADVQTGEAGVTLFVNEIRLGPVIEEIVNNSDIRARLAMVEWSDDGMKARQRGSLAMTGHMTLNSDAIDLVHKNWIAAAPTAALDEEGTHLFEAVLDNRDGGAFAILGSMGVFPKAADGSSGLDFFVGGIKNVDCARVTADFSGLNQLSARISLECSPSVPEEAAQTLQFLLQMALGQIIKQGSEQYGVTIDGKTDREGSKAFLDLTIPEIDKIIAKMRA